MFQAQHLASCRSAFELVVLCHDRLRPSLEQPEEAKAIEDKVSEARERLSELEARFLERREALEADLR